MMIGYVSQRCYRSAMKLIIRITADMLNWIAIAAMLVLLLPFWLIDKAERAVKWARLR